MATDNTVRIFSARACAEPLYKAARDFENLTGSHVSISVCARHCAKPEAEEASGQMDDFLVEISDMAIHDLAIGGAEFLFVALDLPHALRRSIADVDVPALGIGSPSTAAEFAVC